MRSCHDIDQAGGAVVELAISMLVIIPLVFFGSWFSDVAHWKIKLEEASISSTFDLTAWKLNDFSNANPEFAHLYQNAIAGAAHGAGSAWARMNTSFDSSKPGANTFQSSVFVRPRKLKVRCAHFSGGRPNSVALNYTVNASRAGQQVPELNTHTWVTCKAEAALHTAGIPHKYQEMKSESWLFNTSLGWGSLHMCGVGPGYAGCGAAQSAGMSIMLDDWGLSSLTHHEDVDIPLSMKPWNDDTPEASMNDTGTARNNDYFKMAKRYWRAPESRSSQDVVADAMAVAGAGEMGKTDHFHLSYRFGDEHAYGRQETLYGQRGAYGGPDGILRPNAHTGGPWHEHHAEHSGGGAEGISFHAFSNRREGRYMGVPSWPADAQ